MKADFSRGFNPDRKRGMEYRRVLLQQGRVLLDSDVAAMVDANDQLLRHQSHDLGTDGGGRDRAFMTTAGRLYATFRDLTKVHDPVGGSPLAKTQIDYTRRFRMRFPALRLEANSSSGGSMVIDLNSPHPRDKKLVIWARLDQPPSLPDVGVVTGLGTDADPSSVAYSGPLSSLTSTEFRRIEFAAANPDPNKTDSAIAINLAPMQRILIAMVESDHSTANQSFWIQPGRFHIQGLLVENLAEIAYEDQVLPPPSSSLALHPAQTAIAYLEGWERIITTLHDPGIRERALSTGLDTSVRTQAIGQVKVFVPAIPVSADAIHAAFANQALPTGQLTLEPFLTAPDTNPCDVSLEGGFTGRENHLYHIEVHSIDVDNRATFKASREGGSELFAVAKFTGNNIVFLEPDSGLRDGDLVEVLTDVVELGDESSNPAKIENGQLVRPQRLVGRLANVKSVTSIEAGLDQFELLDAVNLPAPLTLPAQLYPPYPPPPDLPRWPLRLRRWHFLIRDVVPPQLTFLENGLQLSISGSFEIGDWWQFESRLTPNDGTLSLLRHGPERLFTPLALLANDASGRPDISEWLDQPFVSAADISADNIRYDDSAARFAGFTVDEANTMQSIFDLLVTRGPGQRIIDRVAHVLAGDFVVGNWEMSVGDGVNSFGDINGANAIQTAIAVVRGLAGIGQPWILRLFVKRGGYDITNDSTTTLVPGEVLILTGEGTQTTTSGVAASSVIRCSLSAGSCFALTGPQARLELENIVVTRLDPFPSATLATNKGGEVRVTRCILQDVTFSVQGSTAASLPEQALVVKDSTVTQSAAVVPIRVSFPSGGACTEIRVEGGHFATQVDAPFARVTSALSPVLWNGLTVTKSTIELGGSNTAIDAGTPSANSGLIAVLTSPGGDQMLSIGKLVFQDCLVQSGSPTVSGIFLHLPSGNDQTQAVSVKSIERVEIRGGRWTIRSDTMQNAALYIGDRTFFPSTTTDTHIGDLIIEDVAFGWSSTSANFHYATTFNANRAFIISANRLRVRNLSLFGTVTRSTFGDIAFFGLERAVVEGVRLEQFRADASAGAVPSDRIFVYSSGDGFFGTDISVIGVGTIADAFGVIVLASGGPASPGKRTVLTNCRVRQNENGPGFFKSNSLDVELIDCSTWNCETGVLFTQIVSGTRSFVTIRGGRFENGTQDGVVITVNSNLAVVTIDGITSSGNSNNGLRITPAFTGSWDRHGPIVTNNRIFGNSGVAQILIGLSSVDLIGGICLGNYCRGTNDGAIQVDTASAYAMRGLSVTSVPAWAEIAKDQTPLSTASPAQRQLAFNMALWMRES
ncbi:MAG TPA: hypothetical protein VIV60_22065 [Polyangiaceae bacterium]